jgi:hypothetical protein
MTAREIIEKFGGQSALAKALGKGQTTVSYWAKTGVIPARWQPLVLDLARQKGIALEASDFMHSKTLPGTKKANEINSLVAVMPSKAATSKNPAQAHLDLGIVGQVEIDGIGMGVLSDGTPFLTQRGLARLCGIHHSGVHEITAEWSFDVPTPRANRIRDILKSHGDSADTLYIPIQQRSGVFYAYPDVVCLAILEYYSFDAGANIQLQAQKNYRLLAGKALREFIYTQVGYDPTHQVPDQWKYFHDRVSLTYNSVPQGYFAVFKEIADMIVTLGQSGVHIDDKFVPDISVGQGWARHWSAHSCENTFGARIQYEHNYPEYFPQAASNPQVPWCYPEEALGEFRRWFRETYIGEGKFAKYIEGQVKDKALPVSFAQLAIAAYVRD